MTSWTHALRIPGPTPDRCTAPVDGGACGCDAPADTASELGAGERRCGSCGHEVVPVFSLRPGLHTPPEQRR